MTDLFEQFRRLRKNKLKNRTCENIIIFCKWSKTSYGIANRFLIEFEHGVGFWLFGFLSMIFEILLISLRKYKGNSYENRRRRKISDNLLIPLRKYKGNPYENRRRRKIKILLITLRKYKENPYKNRRRRRISEILLIP